MEIRAENEPEESSDFELRSRERTSRRGLNCDRRSEVPPSPRRLLRKSSRAGGVETCSRRRQSSLGSLAWRLCRKGVCQKNDCSLIFRLTFSLGDALVVRNFCDWRAHLLRLGKTLQRVDRPKLGNVGHRHRRAPRTTRLEWQCNVQIDRLVDVGSEP
jgi:hypothetical protein